jgi:hypothetical protein
VLRGLAAMRSPTSWHRRRYPGRDAKKLLDQEERRDGQHHNQIVRRGGYSFLPGPGIAKQGLQLVTLTNGSAEVAGRFARRPISQSRGGG